MKIAVVGIDFPLGKREFDDQRLKRLKEILRSSKITPLQIEFLDANSLSNCDGILGDEAKKLDLILSDLELIEAKLINEPDNPLILGARDALEKEILLSDVPFEEADKKLLSGFNLVTLKPIAFLNKNNLPSIPEMIQLIFTNSAMISFFTANEKELHAWPIKKQSTVYEASGSIHSDIQRGFIKAEVIGYDDLIKEGSLVQAKTKGLVKLEDKGYIVKDGDLIQIRFNV